MIISFLYSLSFFGPSALFYGLNFSHVFEKINNHNFVIFSPILIKFYQNVNKKAAKQHLSLNLKACMVNLLVGLPSIWQIRNICMANLGEIEQPRELNLGYQNPIRVRSRSAQLNLDWSMPQTQWCSARCYHPHYCPHEFNQHLCVCWKNFWIKLWNLRVFDYLYVGE